MGKVKVIFFDFTCPWSSMTQVFRLLGWASIPLYMEHHFIVRVILGQNVVVLGHFLIVSLARFPVRIAVVLVNVGFQRGLIFWMI